MTSNLMGDETLSSKSERENDGDVTSSLLHTRARNGDSRKQNSDYNNVNSCGLLTPQDCSGIESRASRLVDVTTFLLDLELEGMSGHSNIVSYSALKTDSHSHEDEYRSLKAFLAACNPAYRRELMSLLFPVFTNLIIDLASKSLWNTAQSLLMKYGPEHEDHYKEEFKRLSYMVKAQVIDDGICKSLRLSERCSPLSKPVLAYLIQHLSKGNHSVLLEILNKYIQLTSSDLTDQEVSFADGVSHLEREMDELSELSFNEEEAKLIRKFDLAIDGIKKTKYKKASICFYSVVNAFQGLTALKFSPKSHFLCGGFEDASVRVWSLTPKKLVNLKGKVDTRSREPSQDTAFVDYICLRGHDGPVYSTDFLVDGSTILSSSEDTSVRLWSWQHQTCLCEYRGHNSPVWHVSSSNNGTYFASASQDRTVRLWSTEYVHPLRIFAGHGNSVDCVAFHQNGNYVASGSSDKTCRLWDLQTGQFVRVLVGQKGSTYCLAFSPDGKYLVSAGDCSHIMIWDLGSGKLVEELNGHNDVVYSLAFSKNGSFLVSGGIDGAIEVWNFKSDTSSAEVLPQFANSHCDFIDTYSTKSCNVLALQFCQANLLYAGGGAEHR